MAEDLEYDGDWDRLPDGPERDSIRDQFHSIVIWHAGMGYILDDGIFDSNGSQLLIRGEY